MAEEDVIYAPLFQPIAAPRLKSADAGAIAEFLQIREQYESLIKERQETHQEKIHAVSIKSSMEPDVLKAIAKYELQKDVTAIKDPDLLKYMKERVGKLMDSGSIDIDALFKEKLIFNLNIEDPVGRVVKLFGDFDRISDDYGLQDIFKDEDGQKMATKLIVQALKPQMLQSLVQDELKYRHRSANKSLMKAFDLIKELASGQEKFFQANRRARMSKSNQGKDDTKKNPVKDAITHVSGYSKQGNGNKQSKQTSSSSENQRGNNDKQTASGKGKKTSPPLSGCLKCKGEHWVKDCPQKPSAEEIRKLYDDFRDERSKTRTGKEYSGASTKSITATRNASMISITIGGLDCAALLDSGADITVIPRNLMDVLKKRGYEERTLDRPVSISCATEGATRAVPEGVIKYTTELPITIKMVTGEVTLPRACCWIVEDAMSMVLIGHPELHVLGIDPKSRLEALIREQEEPSAEEGGEILDEHGFEEIAGPQDLKELGTIRCFHG